MDASITVKSLIHSIRTDLRTVACSALLAQTVFVPVAFAGPTGGNIVAGLGNINQSGLNTTVNQNSARLAIDWQTFNINRNESVNFNQPDASSIALNRILDQNPSQILGSINANGQIILANPNGVFFGKESTVNAGGLFAAALDIDVQDFMEGRLDFKALENTTGLIVNQGSRQTLKIYGSDGEIKGWTMTNHQWDFELQPWIDRKQVVWISPGGDDIVREGPCPYVDLPGTRAPQLIETDKVKILPLPDGSDPGPFSG